MTDTDSYTRKFSTEDIHCGLATVKYGPGINNPQLTGWHLPGGRFTTCRYTAEKCCIEMDKFLKRRAA